MIPNTTQTPNFVYDLWMKELSASAYKVISVIIRQTLGWILDKKTGRRKVSDWIAYSQFKEKTGLSVQTISNALQELEKNKYILVTDAYGNELPRDQRNGKKLYYRITFLETREVVPNLSNFHRSTSLETRETKETLTKVFTKVNNDSPKGDRFVAGSMKKKRAKPNECPNTVEGHKGCIQFISSLAKSRGVKFPAYAKQVGALHKMLASGYTFDDINDQIDAMEEDRFWKTRGFDLANVLGEIGKGAQYGRQA